MPRDWIRRTFEPVLEGPAEQLRLFPVWLLLGPRQVGKSSLLRRASPDHAWVDLDDLEVRERANRDPKLFMRDLEPPFVIDEIQYAPQLLSPIKRLVDRGDLAPGAIRLSGSQNFRVMRGVTETLAGRVAILNLFGLADEEKRHAGASGSAGSPGRRPARGDARPHPPTGRTVNEPGLWSPSPKQAFAALLETGFPRLFSTGHGAARDLYLASYVQTYIERDVRELIRIGKRRAFETFVRIAALRTGQIVNLQDLARDTGVSPNTVKEWLSLLEDSFLIRLVRPYFTNRTRRLTKSPKLYFLDAGLAAWLGGWRDPEQARLGPMGGALFETLVFANLFRYFRHRALEADIHFWRTRDGQEVDFLVEHAGRVWPVEVKLGSPRHDRLAPLHRIRDPHWETGQVVSLAAPEQPVPIRRDWILTRPETLRFA